MNREERASRELKRVVPCQASRTGPGTEHALHESCYLLFVISPTFITVDSARCAPNRAGAALAAEQGHGEWWPLCDQQSLGCGLFETSHIFFSHKFGVARLPKDLGPSDNFLPELLASAGDFFMRDLSQPSLVFSPLHCASLITTLCASALHFHLLSLRLSTMAPTLHTATAFGLLLPCDLLPFVSTLLSLIHALREGQAYLSNMHFISCS